MTEVRKLKVTPDWMMIFRQKIPWDCVTFFILGLLVGTVL
jgi:hypothetical protein